MFWFCKPKPIDVYFYTTREEIFNHSKPKKAIDFIPEWFKQLPSPTFSTAENLPLEASATIRSCPGFINLYKSGFVIPLWSDLNVQISPNGDYKYQFAHKKSGIQPHNSEQFSGSSFQKDYVELKLLNPWVWSTKEKVDFLFSSPTWNGFGYGDCVVAPGVYGTYTTPLTANINLFFKKQAETVVYELSLGQPLNHAIPLSNRPIKLHYELVSEDELKKIVWKSPCMLMFKNRFARAEKLCPHA